MSSAPPSPISTSRPANRDIDNLFTVVHYSLPPTVKHHGKVSKYLHVHDGTPYVTLFKRYIRMTKQMKIICELNEICYQFCDYVDTCPWDCECAYRMRIRETIEDLCSHNSPESGE